MHKTWNEVDQHVATKNNLGLTKKLIVKLIVNSHKIL
jgi:hypothetical protein